MTSEEVVRRYLASYSRLRVDLVARVVAAWAARGGLGDEEARAFVQAVVPVVRGGQVAAARLAAAHIAVLARVATGEAVPVSIPPGEVTDLRGTEPAEVYTRPVIHARAAVSEGASLVEALAAGAARAGQLALTDVILAQRAGATAAMRADRRIVGYRRVLSGQSCALCATASTQRYRVGDLLPIHDRCDCGVAPIIGTEDPGRVINRPLVDSLRRAAEQTDDENYWHSRHIRVDADGTVRLPETAVHQHGELGPVLTRAGDHFKSS